MTRSTAIRKLSKLAVDLNEYNRALQRMFSRKLTRKHDCARYFGRLLVATSKLYLDDLLMLDLGSQRWEKRIKRKPQRPAHNYHELGHAPEFRMHQRFSERLAGLPCWPEFDPLNGFEDENLLRTPKDYRDNLSIHLPEIYGEALKLLAAIERLRSSRSWLDREVVDLVVGLHHLAHHASYCRHALEVLSNELSWTGYVKLTP
jgi:hypothetical protein